MDEHWRGEHNYSPNPRIHGARPRPAPQIISVVLRAHDRTVYGPDVYARPLFKGFMSAPFGAN